MKQHIFHGCATAVITPFTSDGNDVDYSAFEDIIKFQIDNNINALVVAGTTGESPVLSQREKNLMFDIACRLADGKIPVIAGTGSNNTEEAVRKSNEAEKQGVDGLLVVTPYYNKCSQEGIIRHYFYIADRVSAPIIVYNVPSRTGVTIQASTYKALSEHKNIVAVKEASGNISEFTKAVSLCTDALDFYCGNDDQTIPMMSLGAKGVISVVSNIIPDIMTNLTAYCIKNDYNSARTINEKYIDLMNSMFIDVNPIPVKAACNMLFGYNEALRLPLTAMNEKNRLILKDKLYSYNLI